MTVPIVAPCPVCGEVGGFHDYAKHNQIQVPKEHLLDPNWWKEFYAELRRVEREREQKPRVWKLTPSPPPEVTRLRDQDGSEYARDPEDPNGWYYVDARGIMTDWFTWAVLLTDCETLTEVL